MIVPVFLEWRVDYFSFRHLADGTFLEKYTVLLEFSPSFVFLLGRGGLFFLFVI